MTIGTVYQEVGGNVAARCEALSPECILLPEHFHELTVGSGIDREVIARRGYRSVTAAQARELGFAEFQARAGLAIPQWTLARVQVNWLLKPDEPREDDGKPVKYEAPAGSVPHFDIHPDAQPLLRDPSETLYFTEGTKKGDGGWSRGLLCVGLTGVYQFLHGQLVVPDLDEIALRDRLVRVVFDSDVTRKPSVADALLRLCEALRRRGARVEVIYLPEGLNGAKVGLDDWFVAGGTVEDLDALAQPWDGTGPGIHLHNAGDPNPTEQQRIISLLMGAILNPELSRSDLTTMASVASLAMFKQSRDEVDAAGCVVLTAPEIADDWRPEPGPDETHRAPVNPAGTRPRMNRESVRRTMTRAIDRGLISAKPRATRAQHRNGSIYHTTEWVIDPVTSFAELIDPWARYQPGQPKLRKPRTTPEACPHCGEIHPQSQRTYCTGCGAQIGIDKVIQPAIQVETASASDKLSEAETSPLPHPPHLRIVRSSIGGDSQHVHEQGSSPDTLMLEAPALISSAIGSAPAEHATQGYHDPAGQLAYVAMGAPWREGPGEDRWTR